MLGNPAYTSRCEQELANYRELGILPYEEGGGPQGTLIVSHDDPGGGLEAGNTARLIDQVLPRRE